MYYEKLKIKADLAETADELSELKKAILDSESLLSEDDFYTLLTRTNQKEDDLEQAEKDENERFRADANSEYMFAQTGRR